MVKRDKAFYKRIGAMGGKKSRGGGFSDRKLASAAGKKGGASLKRKKAKEVEDDIDS